MTPCAGTQRLENGTVNFLGVFDFWSAPDFPISITFAIALGFEAEPGEATARSELSLTVADPDGVQVFDEKVIVEAGEAEDDGTPWVRYLAAPVAFSATSPGPYEISLRGLDVTHSTTLSVRRRKS